MIQKPWDEITEADIRKVRDQIKDIMQEELDQAVEIHGKKKYSTGKILGNKLSEILRLFYYSPVGWPMLFHEHHRLYLKSKGKPFSIKVSAGSWLRLLIKNPIAIAYYIPVLGWIPILIKGYWKHTISSDK